MNPSFEPRSRVFQAAVVLLLFVAGFGLAASAGEEEVDEIPYELMLELSAPVKAWIGEIAKASKNADGVATKRGTYSRAFDKVDENTYKGSAHIDTAGEREMTTERFQLTLKKGAKGWEIAEENVMDTYVGLKRESGGNCYPFEEFKFDREGMKMNAGAGFMCEMYLERNVSRWGLFAPYMSYDYAPPSHAQMVKRSHDFYALHKMMKKDHDKELVFQPVAFVFDCDPTSCDELIEESFTGLNRVAKEERSKASGYGFAKGSTLRWAEKMTQEYEKELKENAFYGFQSPYMPGHRYYNALVLRDIDPPSYAGGQLPGSGVVLGYNNWDGFEVQFSVFPQRTDLPDQMFGAVFGYYSEETAKNNDLYDLERRDDMNARWHEVHSLSGTVEAGLEDPEILKADLEFGITLKQDLKELPFFIAALPERSATGADRPRTLFVNSIRYNGQELTWVKTGAISGRVVLPDEMPAGTKLKLRMKFSTRAISKENHAFSQMNRFGWMPFVRFGDFIDEFELTIKTPAQYRILGIGHKVAERQEGNVLISEWKSDSPVVFPTIIYGKYVSDDAGKYTATKLDGTVIPVEVHVDEVSMGQLAITINSMETLESADAMRQGSRGIRGKQLRPIATQAAVAINLFKEVSGLDYPYGELNLVNDPAPALYGQAPSSLIYLGSLVFRGEGTMAGGGLFGGATSERRRGGATRTAKFLKSVVAHEVGHQWWGSRVSNANGRNYWFVESLAEYFSALYLEQAFGKKEYEEQVEEWRFNIVDARQMSSVQNASALWTGEDGFGSYQAAVYNKGPYAFHMLRETFGDEKFFPFLKQFSQELASKREIITLDIQRAAEKALGGIDPEGNPYNVDLDWFFDQWIRGAGVPQYRFLYDVRQTEDGGFLIEGKIEQRVIVGNYNSFEVLPEKYYRGVVDITVEAKGGESYERRLVVEGKETPFRLKVPKKPLDVALNKGGEMLSHDVIVNQEWN